MLVDVGMGQWAMKCENVHVAHLSPSVTLSLSSLFPEAAIKNYLLPCN